MSALPQPLAGVFFDLDGTLVDSAPDLYAALVDLCTAEGCEAPPFASVREAVSRGARGVLRRAFPQADATAIEERVPGFLRLYAACMAQHTRPFDGAEALLTALECRGIRWGIVTNKIAALTGPLLQHLDLHRRPAAVVSGDTLSVRKPDPAPVLQACQEAGVAPSQCVFIGDDPRDVEAGRRAGLFTVAAAWGYLDGGDPCQWGADAVAGSLAEVAVLLGVGTVAA